MRWADNRVVYIEMTDDYSELVNGGDRCCNKAGKDDVDNR